ncbi:hypothetical protein E1200_10560 [Actinomadura sp. GC306]|uniref:hypothetical protein n=1 Tax=Actinomadura sp. GC306 TaxID=2530367 RepID=UPI0010498A8C|nr:hypothetical protein [Actinomadura sp. GC306]TDC68788.1 hypothetical protein E1200_10560 [Actinomadura sp. GC306]
MANVPFGVAVIVVSLRRDFRDYYLFYGVVTREFIALDRRSVPWCEVAAHRDPNALAAVLRVRPRSTGR